MVASPASSRKPAGVAARVAAAQKAMAVLQQQADVCARACVQAVLREDFPAARANAKRSKALTDRAAKLFTDATHPPAPR